MFLVPKAFIITNLYFFICLLCNATCDGLDDFTLELVHVFFRHGKRTPIPSQNYPNDPYTVQDYIIPEYGQLTNDGKKQAYQLGKLLGARYKNFVGEYVTSDVVLATTTDVDRTKMTLLMVLAALFPPSPTENWIDDLNWKPVPYHYAKGSTDYTFKRPQRHCTAYTREYENVIAGDDVRNYRKEHEATLKYISNHTGKEVKELIDVFDLYQTLYSEENMNLTLPKWTETVYEEMLSIAIKACQYESFNTIMKRLNGGRALQKTIENIARKSNNTLEPAGRKFLLYSVHDHVMSGILRTLNLDIDVIPDYCSAISLELYFSKNRNQYFVKVVYIKNERSKPEVQQLPECEADCPLENFLEIVKPYIPVNYTEECESTIPLD